MRFDERAASEEIASIFTESAKVKEKLASNCLPSTLAAAKLITECFAKGAKLLVCGNGGSAADSQHFAAEFSSCLTKEFVRPGLPAIALTTDTSFLTAYANDFGFDGIFERQVEALGRPGDLLFGLSTSGNSKNVILAVKKARMLGMQTIVLCGESGQLREMVDVAICVPHKKTARIQEAHLVIEHAICHIVERSLFPAS